MNSIEHDIYRAIDMAYHHFTKNNPELELICDEKVMKDWYNFITWCYAQDGEDEAAYIIKNSPEVFDFEISKLMQEAMDECSGWWCKYNVDHQQVAEEDNTEWCANCEGSGYLDEDYEEECEECERESHWEAYEEAFKNISNSVNTDNFAELSKITID
jgi:hypothetical protein|tara:strand:- start:93 stop:566 length:474 start_codon:yes stop_codon:yes gene_type:complete